MCYILFPSHFYFATTLSYLAYHFIIHPILSSSSSLHPLSFFIHPSSYPFSLIHIFSFTSFFLSIFFIHPFFYPFLDFQPLPPPTFFMHTSIPPQAHQDSLAPRETRDPRDRQETRETQADQASKDPRDSKERLDTLERRAPVEVLETPETLETLEEVQDSTSLRWHLLLNFWTLQPKFRIKKSTT